MDINLKILRYDPESDRKGHWENYIVDAEPEERILDLLHKIKWFEDGSLSFRRSCAHGVCGSDAMIINGENKLHNWEGPALINKEQKRKEYYLNGIQYDFDTWNEIQKGKEGLPWYKNPAFKGTVRF